MKYIEYEDNNYGMSTVLGEDYEDELIYNDGYFRIEAVINKKYSEPYFKVIKQENNFENVWISRISIFSPKYIKTEMEDYELSNEEIDKLLYILNNIIPENTYKCSVSSEDIYNNLEYKKYIDSFDLNTNNVWKCILFKINEINIIDKLFDYEECPNYIPLDYGITIPNYNLLKK